jgi:hypothetical protein
VIATLPSRRKKKKMTESFSQQELQRLEKLSEDIDQRLEALKPATAQTLLLANELLELTRQIGDIRKSVAEQD